MTNTRGGGARGDHVGNAATEPSQHPAPSRNKVGRFGLWFGLFGGPAAWTLQTLINLPLASHACFPQLEPLSSPVVESVRGLAFTVGTLSVIVCILAVGVAWRTWSRTREEHQGSSGAGATHTNLTALLETGEGRTRFMAQSGLMTSMLFLLVTVVNTITIFIVPPCAF